LISSLVPVASLAAQSVLTVGVNGQFPDVPAAVAAAQPGDTVRCLQIPPFQLFTAPVITKGLTFDGGGANGLLLLNKSRQLRQAEDLPALRLVGDLHLAKNGKMWCSQRLKNGMSFTVTEAPPWQSKTWCRCCAGSSYMPESNSA
jgi:hypothetical protein